MAKKRDLADVIEQRKMALLEELSLVHKALVNAQPTEETKQWIERLKRWHNELHALIDNMPKQE